MSETPEPVELRFPFEDGGCFGCSPSNPHGLGLRFHRIDEEVRANYRIDERFHGAPGIAHGGIVAALLDELSCAAAVFLAGHRVVTGELTVRYHAPCPVETGLELRARIRDTEHPRYLVIEAEVLGGERLLARSTGKFFPTEAAPAP